MALKFILKKSAAISIYNLIAVFVRFISVTFFARYLSPAQLGNFTLARSISFLSSLYALFGLNHGILRQSSIAIGQEKFQLYNEIKNYGFTISLFISICLSVIIALFSNFIAVNFFSNPVLSSYVLFFALTIPVMTLNSLMLVIYQTNNQSDKGQFISTLLYPIFILFSFLFFTLFFIGSTLVIVSFLVAHLIYMLILFRPIIKNKIRLRFHLERDEKKKLFSISLPMFLATAINQSQKWIDTFLLGILGSSSQVGIYYVGLRIANFVDIPAYALNQVFMPIAGRMVGKNDFTELNSLYKSITKIIFFIGSIIFFFILWFQVQIVSIFGKDFSSSSSVIIYILIGELINIGVGATRQLLTICGGARINLINSIIMVLVLIITSIILIPEYGMVGAAISHAITVGLLNIISVIQLLVIFKLSPFDSRYFLIVIFFILLILLYNLVGNGGVIVFIISLGLYLFLSYLFGITKGEREQLVQLFYRKFMRTNKVSE